MLSTHVHKGTWNSSRYSVLIGLRVQGTLKGAQYSFGTKVQGTLKRNAVLIGTTVQETLKGAQYSSAQGTRNP